MIYTFLGHQSWMFEEGNTKVLVDPLLYDTFADDTLSGIEVVPPRIISKEVVNNISAVFISHEHSDHFHPASLAMIPRAVPFYVGELTLNPVVETLEKMGFSVHRVKSCEQVTVGDLLLTFYQAHPKTILWESRVYQIRIQSKATGFSIFLAIDALISKDFGSLGEADRIDALLISNNSQIPPIGAIGPLDNTSLPQSENRQRTGPVGLALIKAIIIDYSDQAHDLEHIILCGGGFMKSNDKFGEFLMSNQSKVSELANPIFPDKEIFGAVPGMQFKDENHVGFSSLVIGNKERATELKSKFEAFLEDPQWTLGCLIEEHKPFDETCKNIIWSLESRSLGVFASHFGTILRSYGTRRPLFCLILVDKKGGERIFHYRHWENQWSMDSSQTITLYGVRARASDLEAVCDGRIQIWDIAGHSIHSWYDPNIKASINLSPMGFLYALLGEHFNVEQFRKQCANQLESIDAPWHN